MTRSSISTILIVLTASAAPLCAQAGAAGPVHFGIMGGATIPTHYLADYYSGFDAHTGGSAGVFFAIAVPNSPFSIRFDGQWQQLSSGNGSPGPDYRIIDATADLVYTFYRAARTNFYVIGGSGVYNEHAHADFFDYTASATHYGFNGGAGMNFRLGRFSTFVESRYHYVIRGSRIGAPSCEVLSALIAQTCPSDTRPSLQFVPISAGFAF
jgi:hypothetical protein